MPLQKMGEMLPLRCDQLRLRCRIQLHKETNYEQATKEVPLSVGIWTTFFKLSLTLTVWLLQEEETHLKLYSILIQQFSKELQ